ncbi:MAG: hypothetical protein ABJP45_18225 [Cyclobacteriaceae bacterium]
MKNFDSLIKDLAETEHGFKHRVTCGDQLLKDDTFGPRRVEIMGPFRKGVQLYIQNNFQLI